MPARPLDGILAPAATPFEANGDLLPAAFQANVRAHLAAGLSGIVVAGSSGEAPLLAEDERAVLLELARGEVPDDRWLVAGIGGESTRLTIARARVAAQRGADRVLVVAPHYFGAGVMTPEALRAHFLRVADASPVPLLLYNIPKFAHLVLEPALVHELARHGNIAGMKDSAGDLEKLAGYLGAQGPAFTVLTGHAPTLARAAAMGVRGAVLAVSLFAPALARDVLARALAGDAAGAADAQERLAPLGREVAGALGPAGIKAAMTLVGLDGGTPRAPLLPLSAEARERVARLLREAGVRLAPAHASAA
jgi:4-hydroxy-2-oxoglutarate aldolase